MGTDASHLAYILLSLRIKESLFSGCLKKLSISYNENITMEILEGGILKNENVPLEKVILSKCENITKSDIQRYEKYLKSKNYNVEVNWE